MQYYLKKCGFQELGSVLDGGKAKRGRYLMVSQNKGVLAMFPPLQKNILNDNTVLPLLPLYIGKKVYCNFVYHNSKFNSAKATNNRNEYRIYLNSELEKKSLYFQSDDIVIIRKATEHETDDEIYYMDVLKDHSSGLYVNLSLYIERYPIRGGYAIYEGKIDYFENSINNLLGNKLQVVIDDSVTNRIFNTSNNGNVFNSSTFRDFVLRGYNDSCALTGRKVDDININGVDVVYIRPLHCDGTNMPNNGIPLEHELSLAFVQGKFSLTDNYEVIVHPYCKENNILQYNLRQINVPYNSFYRPDIKCLDYHRTFIFGSFLRGAQDN